VGVVVGSQVGWGVGDLVGVVPTGLFDGSSVGVGVVGSPLGIIVGYIVVGGAVA